MRSVRSGAYCLSTRSRTSRKHSGYNIPLFFFSSRRRHTRWNCDWSSDVCSSDLVVAAVGDDDDRLGRGKKRGRPALSRRSRRGIELDGLGQPVVEQERAAGEGDLRGLAGHLALLLRERGHDLGGLRVVHHRHLVLLAQAVDERRHRLLDVVLDPHHRARRLHYDDDGGAGLRRLQRVHLLHLRAVAASALVDAEQVLREPLDGRARRADHVDVRARVRPLLLRRFHLLDGELRASGQRGRGREERREACPEMRLHGRPYSRFSRMARHLNSNWMSPSLMMSLSIRSCFCTFSSFTKVPFELSKSAIWNSPPSKRRVACLREIFLSVRTMSQSAAVPSTFFPERSRKSSPLCCPFKATIQPHTSRLLSCDPRPFSPPISWRLSIAVPWPAPGIGIGVPAAPPPPIISCCISRQ